LEHKADEIIGVVGARAKSVTPLLHHLSLGNKLRARRPSDSNGNIFSRMPRFFLEIDVPDSSRLLKLDQRLRAIA
jgi:hypothetical protein